MGNRRRTNLGATTTKKKKEKRTKESGKAVGQLETARAAKRHSKPRKDSIPAMLRIHDGGWDYSEEVAKNQNSDEKGYYILTTVKALITPDDAYELFCQHNYARQRHFDEKYARRLAENMVAAPNLRSQSGCVEMTKVRLTCSPFLMTTSGGVSKIPFMPP